MPGWPPGPAASSAAWPQDEGGRMTRTTMRVGETRSPASSTDPRRARIGTLSREKSVAVGTAPRIRGEHLAWMRRTDPRRSDVRSGDPKRDAAGLIRLLKSPDRAVRARAAAAPRRPDPPPVRDVDQGPVQGRGRELQGRDHEGHAADWARRTGPASTLTMSPTVAGARPGLRQAIIDAVLVMGPAPVEASPTPAGAAPTQDDAPSGRARTRPSPSPSRPGR